MPELSEVEKMRRAIERALKGKKIVKVTAFEDPIVFAGTSHTEFAKHLTGQKLTGTGRHGKWFWLEFEKAPHVVAHCGMTGNIRVKGETPMKFMDFAVADVWPPKFAKWILHTDDTEVAFSDARRLGRTRLVNSPRTEPPISDLGFDPYTSMPPLKEFIERARKRAVPIKALLLDQQFSAGVGNWIADEILYQARIHPEERVPSLDDDDLARIQKEMKDIVTKACEAEADPAKFPQDWLFHTKWSKGKKDAKTNLGEKISFVTVGGRTSAFVAERQKLKPKRPGGGAAATVPPKSVKGKEKEVVEEEVEVETSEKKGRSKKMVKTESESPAKASTGKRGRKIKEEEEAVEAEAEIEAPPAFKKRRTAAKPAAAASVPDTKPAETKHSTRTRSKV